MTFRGIVFTGLLIVLVGSIAVRAATSTNDAHASSTSAAIAGSDAQPGANSFVGGTTGTPPSGAVTPTPNAPAEAPGTLLPYLTEGSFFGILGFALGFTSRKIVKLFLILIALIFAAVQGLAFAGVAEVDWGKALKLANDLVFNVNQNQSWLEFMKAKIPSAGAFAGGFILGFRKG